MFVRHFISQIDLRCDDSAPCEGSTPNHRSADNSRPVERTDQENSVPSTCERHPKTLRQCIPIQRVASGNYPSSPIQCTPPNFKSRADNIMHPLPSFPKIQGIRGVRLF